MPRTVRAKRPSLVALRRLLVVAVMLMAMLLAAAPAALAHYQHQRFEVTVASNQYKSYSNKTGVVPGTWGLLCYYQKNEIWYDSMKTIIYHWDGNRLVQTEILPWHKTLRVVRTNYTSFC